MKLQRQWLVTGTLFIMPALILFCLFTMYPFLKSIYYSFTQWNMVTKPIFTGLENYKYLLRDRKMLSAAENTLAITLFGIFIQNPISIFFAIVLNRKFITGHFLRTAFYFPVIVSLVVVSVIWGQILSFDGTLNVMMRYVGLDSLTKDWLGTVGTVFKMIILLTQWQGIGFCIIIYLAGLQSIPPDLYEAAIIDGAGSFRRLSHITLPLLMPTITIVTFLIIVGGLKLFDIPYVLTSGGPGSASYTVGLAIYNAGFRDNTAGYSIAGGMVLMLIIIVITLVQLGITRSREVEL